MSTSNTVRIAVAQQMCFPGDVDGNLERMEPLIEHAAGEGARLVLFGESNVTGLWPDPKTASSALEREGRAWRELLAIAHQHEIVVAAGFLERDDEDRIYNAHGAFFPDGRVVVQRKCRGTPTEFKIPGFTNGSPERVVFEVEGVRCSMTICADSGIPDLWNILARQGVQVHLVPTAGCGPRSWGYTEASLDDPAVFQDYMKKAGSVVFSPDAIVTCRQHRMAMASSNQMADNGVDYFHPGHSMIVDTTGELSALIPGTFIFEHLRPRVVWGDVHPQTPRATVLPPT